VVVCVNPGPASIKAASGWRGEGVEQLASVVASSAQMALLSTLNLSNNRLSDEALVLLSKGLSQTGCCLADLDLSHNNFGREGARGNHLASISAGCCTLSLTVESLSCLVQRWDERC
jgi:hypothetical protein